MARTKTKKLTDADILNNHHQRTCAGFYSNKGGRFFAAKMVEGALHISDDWGETFRPQQDGEFFRDHNGRTIFLNNPNTVP